MFDRVQGRSRSRCSRRPGLKSTAVTVLVRIAQDYFSNIPIVITLVVAVESDSSVTDSSMKCSEIFCGFHLKPVIPRNRIIAALTDRKNFIFLQVNAFVAHYTSCRSRIELKLGGNVCITGSSSIAVKPDCRLITFDFPVKGSVIIGNKF